MTPTAVISVRGTTFDVSVDEDDETTQVDVEEGTVVVSPRAASLAIMRRRCTPANPFGCTERADRFHQLDKNTVFRYAPTRCENAAMMLTSHGAKITLPGGSGGGSGIPGDTCKPGVAGCRRGRTSLPGTSFRHPRPRRLQRISRVETSS